MLVRNGDGRPRAGARRRADARRRSSTACAPATASPQRPADRSPGVRGLRRHAAAEQLARQSLLLRNARRSSRREQHRRRPRQLRHDGREARRAAGLGHRRRDRGARPVGHELLAVHLPEPVAGAGRHQPAAERAGARPRRRDPRPGHRLQDAGCGRTTRVSGRATGSTEPGHWPPCRRRARTRAPRSSARSTAQPGRRSGATRVQDDDLPHPRRERVAVPAPAWHQPAGRVPFETDADGNPLADLWTNARRVNPTLHERHRRRPGECQPADPCTTVGTNVPDNGSRTPAPRSTAARSTCRWSTARSTVGLRRGGLGGPVVLQQPDLHRGQGLDAWSPASK